METNEIIKKIQALPLQEKMYMIEKSIHLIREHEFQTSMEVAADELYENYKSDEELTIFTQLDFEEFYEAKQFE